MQNGQRPQRPQMTRAEYMRRKRILEQRRRRRMICRCVFTVLLIAVLIAAVFAVKSMIGGKTPDNNAQTSTTAADGNATEATAKDTQTTESTTAENKNMRGSLEMKELPDTEFQVDLSAFESYMMPENTDDYLILVNKHSTIDENYVPDVIPVVNSRSDRTEYMLETAEKALEALFLEAEAEGMTYVNPATYQQLSVMSGYRSYDRQYNLFNTYVSNEMSSHGWDRGTAEEYVKTYSNPAGTSEHQTGLCCDMHNLSSADQSFANQQAATWLAENCWKFGFILRYPENKEDITETSYEPWHFRFVGRYHAYQIYANGMCLEEYLTAIQ